MPASRAKSGWANVSEHVTEVRRDHRRISAARYEIALNTYKPFACGIVHSPGDRCVRAVAQRAHLTADAIERIDLRVHPLVLELTGQETPQTGLEGKFSVYFAAARRDRRRRRRRQASSATRNAENPPSWRSAIA